MSIIIGEQHRSRQDSILKLKKMMNYPGRFPILVIGDTGTGKTFWIKQLVEEASEFKNQIKIINGSLCEDTLDYWEKNINEANNHFLLISEVDQLSKKSQEFLFEAMSTTNGKYGFDEKKLTIRIIFSTTFPIEKIRDDRRYLSAKFFDRISQFVVVFPNFDVTQRNIYSDFEATWIKMFEKDDIYRGKCPSSDDLKSWLNKEAHRMSGGFRDLDKIVINWNLHQIDGLNENEILNLIKIEFRELLHNPSRKIYEENVFVFTEDTKYADLLNNFRNQLKQWVLAINNSDKHKAARYLGISHRTMERWL